MQEKRLQVVLIIQTVLSSECLDFILNNCKKLHDPKFRRES